MSLGDLVRGASDPVRRARALDLALGAGIVAWGLVWLAPGLGHPGIHDWDEAMHQAATRGTFESFFFPHLWTDPLYPVNPNHWWGAQVWLHKPTLPLWLGALMMHLVGVTPLALRLVSLGGQLVAALSIYALARGPAGRVPSALAAMGFLALPFGWRLTQGLMFGDVYDCLLAGLVALTVALTVQAVERDSLRWAALAGAALGLAHLAKTVLALAPLGVAAVLVGLRWLKLSKGLRPLQFLTLGAMALVVSGPWNLFCAIRWPEAFRAAMAHSLGHLASGSAPEVGPWHRPLDAVFNELLSTELSPLPVWVPILSGIWLGLRAIWKREPAVIAVALWLWSTWLTHSAVSVKVPAQVWSATPAVWVGIALLVFDSWRFPALGASALGAIAVPALLGWFPWLGGVRAHLPRALVQTRAMPGLAEGAVCVAVIGLVVWGLWRAARRPAPARWMVGVGCAVAFAWMVGFKLPSALASERERHRVELRTSHTREVGLALAGRIPERSVLFQRLDRDPPGAFEVQNLMFWSGRMTYRREPDLETARARGYHPFLISPAAEPYAPVEGVPAHAWLRAYDLERPAAPPPPPERAHPLDLEVDGLEVLAWASGEVDGEQDAYTFFIRPKDLPGPLEVRFVSKHGEARVRLEPEASLRSRSRLKGVAWFVLPTLGPKRGELEAIELGSTRARVELPP